MFLGVSVDNPIEFLLIIINNIIIPLLFYIQLNDYHIILFIILYIYIYYYIIYITYHNVTIITIINVI